MFSKSAAGKSGGGSAKPGGIVRVFNEDASSSASYSVTSNHRTTSLNSSHMEHSTATSTAEHTNGTSAPGLQNEELLQKYVIRRITWGGIRH